MVNWIGLLLPFIYLGILVGALSTFSSLYRNRKAYRARTLAPWFDSHPARDLYFSLLALDEDGNPEKGGEGKGKVPESLMKAALLRRAMADVNRVMDLRANKPAMSQLLHRGSIGDDLWQRFLRAEQETQEEANEVMAEANNYEENWGQFIFQSAHEMAQNQYLRERLADMPVKSAEEKEWWEKKKASIQSEFMKELDEESSVAKGVTKSNSDDDTVLVESGGPAVTQGKKKKKAKN